MRLLSDFTNLPVDTTIKTAMGLKAFLIRTRRMSDVYKPSNALKFCLRFAANMKIGSLDIILPDHRRIRFLGKEDGPNGILIIHNDHVAKRFLIGGKLGFCESYLDGDWSSPDIAQFFEVILRNTAVMRPGLRGKEWFRRLSQFIHSFNKNSKSGSKKNIYSHYDLGNDFYAKWLDPSMTYSSGLFKSEDDTLEQAQFNKYQSLAEQLGIEAHHHVLEIGCGWGGFAHHVAQHIGAKMTCVTISKAQYEYAVKRIKNAGLEDKVTIKLQDYRDIKGQYDRIASIEMFEAVGEKYWPTYFQAIKQRLKPDGKAGLQIITIKDEDFESYRRSADYIQRYIFPGGMLPSMVALREETQSAALSIEGHIAFGRDYAKTLNLWNKAFQDVWPLIKNDSFDDRFKRLWEQYLCYCEAGFNVGNIDVIQIILKH